ncbi:MAG: M24 family metallopeptidase [Micromonosporaceae bacterium]|nr:M24 family metallopeptidase [Micromonosporaceae bacterium]
MVDDDLYPPERLGTGQRAAAAAGLDALLVTPGADLRYLTGYQAKAGERLTCLVLPATGEPTLIVPRLERPAAESSPAPRTGVRIVDHADGSDPYPLVAAALGGGLRAVGLSNRTWAEQVLGLRAALPGVAQRLAGDVLRGLRMRKSPAEVAALREAGTAIDAVHARMPEWLAPGRTERQVGADIATGIQAAGNAFTAFVTVAAGPNGASPHHTTSDRVIERGDPVVVDIGGVMPSGYCSDSTRTYVVGGPPPVELAEAYQVLERAQREAVGAVAPGVPAGAVDAVARDLLTTAGYGPAFLHRIGHGIGLDGHEDPYLVTGSRQALEPGMVFSVEPGVYLAGRYGARIEDIVVCTDDGAERLNRRPTELLAW